MLIHSQRTSAPYFQFIWMIFSDGNLQRTMPLKYSPLKVPEKKTTLITCGLLMKMSEKDN